MEVTRKVAGSTVTMDCTRYYNFAGNTVASRTTASQSLTWLFSDHQGTQQVALNAYTQKASVRRQTPYGSPRGTNPLWPTSKGFVGGDIDPTGLIHIGAREYDPQLGRFISVDPLQDLMDPQQWNAYSYAGNNPVTYSDPTGMIYPIEERGETQQTSCDDACQNMATEQNRDNDASSGGSGGGGGGGGGHAASKPKKRHWWERATDWVSDNKNVLIGAGVGIVTFAGCTAITGGAGALGCMGVAGAAGNTMTNYLDGNLHTAGDWADSLAGGAVAGMLAVPLAAADFAVQGKAVVDNVKEGDYAGAAGHSALAALDAVTVVTGVKGVGKTTSVKGVGKRCHSFAPATAVLLADGTTKPLRDITVGDKVVATDPETGDSSAESVEVLHDNLDHEFVNLTVALSDGTTSVIHTTANHPFWDKTLRSWIDAADLSVGHKLQAREGDHEVAVSRVNASNGSRLMRDITVANTHTYYVLAGTTPVLVHNCGEVGLDSAGEAYVRSKHMPGGDKVDDTKGVFNADEDLYQLADDSNNFPATLQDNGNCMRVCNAGRVIGREAQRDGGMPTNVYTVVTDTYGGVITMHPGVRR